MKTIIADIIARANDVGGLPWGLWNNICLFLQPVGSSARLAVTVREIDFHGFIVDGSAHTVTFESQDQELDLESMNIGTNVEVWFDKWQHVDNSWQRTSPVAHGVVTYIL